MRLEAIRPILYRWPGGEIYFQPGVPVEVPDDRAQRILAKAAGAVRPVSAPAADPIRMDPVPADPAAARSAAEPLVVDPAPASVRPVYWECLSAGRILGPARVVAFGKAGPECWLCIEYAGTVRWIRDSLLRSRADAARAGLAGGGSKSSGGSR